jgi:50S ribosomal subunit-associated GTPase HflX
MCRDISHPDTEHQNQEVLKTFTKLKLPQALCNNMITVANKIDRIQVRRFVPLMENVKLFRLFQTDYT